MVVWQHIAHGSVAVLQERIAQSRPAGAEGRASKDEAGPEEKGMTAVVKGSHMSLVDASHTTCVTDLHWLPGMAFTRDGRPPTATRVGCSNPWGHSQLTPAAVFILQCQSLCSYQAYQVKLHLPSVRRLTLCLLDSH